MNTRSKETRQLRQKVVDLTKSGSTRKQINAEFPNNGPRVSETLSRLGLSTRKVSEKHLITRKIEQAIMNLIAVNQKPKNDPAGVALVNQALGRPLDTPIKGERFSEAYNFYDLLKDMSEFVMNTGTEVVKGQLEKVSSKPRKPRKSKLVAMPDVVDNQIPSKGGYVRSQEENKLTARLISLIDGAQTDKNGSDIIVHHFAVEVKTEAAQFKYAFKVLVDAARVGELLGKHMQPVIALPEGELEQVTPVELKAATDAGILVWRFKL